MVEAKVDELMFAEFSTGFQIVDTAQHAPRPRCQRAPVIPKIDGKQADTLIVEPVGASVLVVEGTFHEQHLNYSMPDPHGMTQMKKARILFVVMSFWVCASTDELNIAHSLSGRDVTVLISELLMNGIST